jgi:hypothetical protein
LPLLWGNALLPGAFIRQIQKSVDGTPEGCGVAIVVIGESTVFDGRSSRLSRMCDAGGSAGKRAPFLSGGSYHTAAGALRDAEMVEMACGRQAVGIHSGQAAMGPFR